MESQAEKAEYWLKKADKKLKSFSFFGSSAKYEDASEYYQKAGNSFKMAKKWQEAGDCFVKAAECQEKLQSKHEAGTLFIDAASAYKKQDGGIPEAVNMYRRSVEIFTDLGRFSQAAKYQKEIAELYESETDLENAIAAYQVAADYYLGEDATSSANQCLLKVAHFSAQSKDFTRAIDIYEQVARASLDNALLKWSCKEYFFRAGLCYLAQGDLVTARKALERYQDMDTNFASQRECKLLLEITDALEDQDVESFTNAVYEFDSISKLDPWKTSILLDIKKTINDLT
eukprot:TRINITY_DN24001_c0_g1_i1.p1 TRINITY_DN24001_c0_g1~~TRINITY_DN24001_c0_g1_i1.p1  ORF type:complete len:287 (+),score=90.16 TRINITY_DN24001_c0_g1_i1:262-1122(+)